MYFDSSVSFAYFSFLNDLVWLLYLDLNDPPAKPKYDDEESPEFTVALYTTDLTKHSPRNGQFSFTLQLHFLTRGSCLATFMIFALCVFMMFFIFFIQL